VLLQLINTTYVRVVITSTTTTTSTTPAAAAAAAAVRRCSGYRASHHPGRRQPRPWVSHSTHLAAPRSRCATGTSTSTTCTTKHSVGRCDWWQLQRAPDDIQHLAQQSAHVGGIGKVGTKKSIELVPRMEVDIGYFCLLSPFDMHMMVPYLTAMCIYLDTISWVSLMVGESSLF